MSVSAEQWKKINDIFDEGYRQMAANLGFPDWTYRDLPYMKPELVDQFIDLVGEENIHWITFARVDGYTRGQVLLSPEAMSRIDQYAKERSLKDDA